MKKNIYLIPTNKPSKLYKIHDKLLFEEYPSKTVTAGNHELYVISDEEIKEGDWCIDIDKKVFKHENHFPISIGQRKIILTTDQELIKDGVQAIDDNFLEWHVKNSSCEFVETFKIWKSVTIFEYEITIPKEETNYNMKQEILDEMEKTPTIKSVTSCPTCGTECTIGGTTTHYYIPKKKNMYSEEEVLDICSLLIAEQHDGSSRNTMFFNLLDWFEQFKKIKNESKG